MQEIQENIAQKLRVTMKHRQKTIAGFAAELGISQTALKNYLRGESNPRADTITLLAERLGLTPAELISGTQKKRITRATRPSDPLFIIPRPTSA